jgi:tRNA(Ile)-lysidine synthase
VSDLLDRVEQRIRTRRLFRPGQSILVAVSGGVDSVVLLHVLHQLARKHRWQLTAAHFNHRLRGRSSEADERLVRRMAEHLKVPVLTEGADVRAFARAQKLSLEMAARKLRHDFLARAAARGHIRSVALAHHADDQLELFFLRLLRGSGGEGLGGMKWRNPSPSDPDIELVHPLLDQPKAVLLEYAAEQGIRYREDASNAALDFQRNRVRHELLPLLRRKYQPALDRTILRVMDIIGEEAEFAAEAARGWLGRMESPKAEGRRPIGRLARIAFDGLPVAVERRCVQLQLLNLGIVPDFELVEQLRTAVDKPVGVSTGAHRGTEAKVGPLTPALSPLEGEKGKRRQAAGELRLRGKDKRREGPMAAPLCAVRERSGLVRLQAAEPEGFKSNVLDLELKGRAGEVEFDGARISWRIDLPKDVGRPIGGVGRECFDADRVGSLVRLRHWQPGDRFQPIGMPCPVRLQDFFTNQKVARDRRRRLIVAATEAGEVFWVEGMRISERFKLTKGTIRRLQWRWKRL